VYVMPLVKVSLLSPSIGRYWNHSLISYDVKDGYQGHVSQEAGLNCLKFIGYLSV